jgi:hypothetical protein
MTTIMNCCGSLGRVFAREAAERPSAPKLEAIQELATTHWSDASAAGGASVAGVREALQKLDHTYCHRLYGFVLRLGYPPAEAQDLPQGFWAALLLSG